jgi:hypothetical protein
LGFRDVIALIVRGRVAVRVAFKGKGWVDGDGFGAVHELWAGDFNVAAAVNVLCSVAESEENTTGAPGELVAQRVVGAFRGWEAAAVGCEWSDLTVITKKKEKAIWWTTTRYRNKCADMICISYLTTGLVNLVNNFDGIEMIDPRVLLTWYSIFIIFL